MRPIEFVYFDLGNVLAQFSVERACSNVANRWGVDTDLVRQSLWTSGVQDRYEHGHEDDDSVAEIARRAWGLNEQDAPTRVLVDSLSDMFEPVLEMEAVVDDVRRAGIKVGILSNTCLAHWRWLLESADYPALRGRFDSTVLSFEVGVMKPQAAIYHQAKDQAGVDPAAILFLDDRIDNVEAALACGWQANQFTDATAARELLRQKGVIE